jgi:hypothetical protein
MNRALCIGFFLALVGCNQPIPTSESTGLQRNPSITIEPIKAEPAPFPIQKLPAPTFEGPKPLIDVANTVSTRTDAPLSVRGTWSTVGHLLEPDKRARVFMLPDGRVLFFGLGFDEIQDRVVGSGELFQPDTGQTTPILNLDYTQAYQLENGQVMFTHEKRTSILDARNNTFKHLPALPFDVRLGFKEAPNNILRFEENDKVKHFDLNTGTVTVSNEPASKVLTFQGTTDGYSYTVWQQYFQDRQDNTWSIRPNFDIKAPRGIEQLNQGDVFALERLSPTGSLLEASQVTLPVHLNSIQFLNDDILDFSGRAYDGGVASCQHVFFSLKRKKILTRFLVGCGRYSGFGGRVLLNETRVLFYNSYGHPGWSTGGKTIIDLETGLQMPGPAAQQIQAIRNVHRLKDGRVVFFGGRGCPISEYRSGYEAECNQRSPRDWLEVLNPNTGLVTLLPDSKQVRVGSISVQLSDGRVLVAGGSKEIPKPGVYDSHQSTYEPISSIEIFTP